MKKVETLIVGQLATNCYLLSDSESRRCFIIDPGDDAGYIMNRVVDLNLKPQAILATHGHFDHILAVTELKLAYKIPFMIHREDAVIVNRMEQTAKYFTGITTDPAPHIDQIIKNNAKFNLGKIKLEAIHTPGHTPGSICLYAKNEGIIFTGDTIFANGNYGRTDLPGGDSKLLKDSILKILSLPDKTEILSGHGEKTSVAKEKTFYKYL